MSVAGNVVAANAFSMRGSHRNALQPLPALALLRAGDLFDPFTLIYMNPGGSAGVQPAWCFHAFAVILHARIDRQGAAKTWHPAQLGLSINGAVAAYLEPYKDIAAFTQLIRDIENRHILAVGGDFLNLISRLQVYGTVTTK